MALLGGSTEKDHARRILKALVGPTVLQEYSYRGHRGKGAFCTLIIHDVLVNAVQFNAANTPVNVIENALKDLFRHVADFLPKQSI